MAPRLFTKLMKVVYASLRKLGFANIGYIDDSLLLGDTFFECKKNIEETVSLVTKLGFIVHRDKSIFIPTKQIQFLGFIIDTEKMTVTLPVEKKDIISQETSKLFTKDTATIREVARVLGLMVSSFSAVEIGPLYYRNTEKEKIKALKNSLGNFEANMNITNEMKLELKWWSDNIHDQKRVIDRNNPEITIQTDASKEGWGAVLNKNKTGSVWNKIERDNHINYLELLAIFYALKSFKNELKNICHVKIMTDNTTAVSYINKMGGVKSELCNDITKKIWFWCIEHEIWVTATHIAGKRNTEADFQSRNFNDQIEWQLDTKIFRKLCSIWGTPEIDLFASHLNTQLKTFCSWTADPESSFVDCFSLDWNKFYSYLFPPFSMIGRCVKKIQKDQAEVLFVGPLWPTQPWYVNILKLLVDTPIIIPARKKLLTLPYKDLVHPLEKTLNLMVCRLSGASYKSEEFQKSLQISSWHPGDQGLRNNINHISGNGFFSVIKDRVINFKQL